MQRRVQLDSAVESVPIPAPMWEQRWAFEEAVLEAGWQESQGTTEQEEVGRAEKAEAEGLF